jgi:hypothetical protein
LSKSSPDAGIVVILTSFGDMIVPYSGNDCIWIWKHLCGNFYLMKRAYWIAFVFAMLTLQSCDKDEDTTNDVGKVFLANGNINAVVDQFRQSLGNLNTMPGATGGRREISWEAIPDSLLEKKLPAQFFNQIGPNASPSFQRGLAYAPTSDFRVSKTLFAGIDAEASTEFQAFSGTATFANVAESQWPVMFQVAGTTEDAAVRGFGMVVSDVDVANSVQIEFFNGNSSIGKLTFPTHSGNSKYSFAAILFDQPLITSVKVTHQGILAPGTKDITQGGSSDLIVMDDFIYGEPIKK